MKKLLFTALLLASNLAFGANEPFKTFVVGQSAAAANDGTEVLPEIQGGNTVKATSAAVGNSGTLTGDCTKATAATAVTCTKTSGVSFAASATTDTTNATNLTSGTVAAARGGAGTITGALKGSGAGVVSQAACADLSNASASCSTDATNAANISSGTLSAARLPASVPIRLIQSGIPFILAPSGTMANNGAVTLGTALDTTYGNAYCYMPAGAIVAASTAGWYFCQMTSTTVGTICNNTYTTGQPTIPGSCTAFATTGPGAYTQTTATDLVAIVYALPGNSLGANGGIEVWNLQANNNSAGVKKTPLYFGGTSVAASSQTTSTFSGSIRSLRNRGVTGAQVAINGVGGDGGSGSSLYLTKDTTASQNIELRLNIAVATDWVILESFMMKLWAN